MAHEVQSTTKMEENPEQTKTTSFGENENKNKKKLNIVTDKNAVFFIICIVGVTLGIVLDRYSNSLSVNDAKDKGRLKYWTFGERDQLKHVNLVLGRLGFVKTTNESDWDLLWSYTYPFNALQPHLYQLKHHQKVNHFPGIAYLTHKVDLATTPSKFIPKAFRLPKNKKEFLEYAAEKKDSMFVEKENTHRGVVLKNISEVDVSGERFVQEYVTRPFLVDGYKFDIGVYVVLTSVEPLRVYYYKGDVLFRYCPEKYYPLDPVNKRQYVVADEYRPTWRVPALEGCARAGYSMKDCFDNYARSQGKDTNKMWQDVNEAIAEIFLKKERHIISALKNYSSKENFFELFRVDLMVDEELKVYLLEVNMSPNLMAESKPPNQLLYEQVIYNTLSLVGLGSTPYYKFFTDPNDVECATGSLTDANYAACKEKEAASAMVSAAKNIAVWGHECGSSCSGAQWCEGLCALCRPCMTPSLRRTLHRAYAEHLHRADFGRIFPPPMKPEATPPMLDELTPSNRLMYWWFQGKCLADNTWCS